MDNEKEISFGAFDSELMHQEIFIPEGFEATIDGNKIILTRIENEGEQIRKALLRFHKSTIDIDGIKREDILAWLKKQGTSYTKKDVDDAYVEGMVFAKNELEKQSEQKPAWSEEDEVKINRIVACLENLNVADNDILLKDVDWLKSLKDRYSWKPSSELDETSYQVGIKRVLENPESYGLTKYNWKPSDKQMHAFEQVYDWYNNNFAPSETLTSLYKDLEKLKGE